MYRRSIETRQDETNKENGGQRERYSAVGYVATDCDKEEEEEKEVQLHEREKERH